MVKKIVLAEDDPDIRLILNMVLHEAGYEVEPLPAGDTIVEGKHAWPDLFILDKALPVIDGLAISKFLKVKEETKNIPIIMISCYHKLKHKAKQAGVDDFIEKPFNIKQLLSVVDKHIGKNEVETTIAP
jgi:DNA-binding response OmpR family regulator